MSILLNEFGSKRTEKKNFNVSDKVYFNIYTGTETSDFVGRREYVKC